MQLAITAIAVIIVGMVSLAGRRAAGGGVDFGEVFRLFFARQAGRVKAGSKQ